MTRSSAKDLLTKKPRAKREPDLRSRIGALSKEEVAANKWYKDNSKLKAWVHVYEDGVLLTTVKLTKTQRLDYVIEMLTGSGKEILEYNPVLLWSVRVMNEDTEQIWVYHHQESWEEKCCHGQCFSL